MKYQSKNTCDIASWKIFFEKCVDRQYFTLTNPISRSVEVYQFQKYKH